MNKNLFFIVAGLLFAAGVALALSRSLLTGVPLIPGKKNDVWLVEARVDFTAHGGPVKVSLDIPVTPPGFVIYHEQTTSPGYGFSFVKERHDRRGEWAVRYARGPQTLYYKGQFIPDRQASPAQTKLATPKKSVEKVYWDEPLAMASGEILRNATRHSSDTPSLTRELIRELSRADNPDAKLILAAFPMHEALKRLLLQSGLHSRIALGLRLEDARRNQSLEAFVEVFDPKKKSWLLYDPKSGRLSLDENLLMWHQDGPSLIDVEGGTGAEVRFSMIHQSVPALQLAKRQQADSLFDIFSVHQLPVEEQSMFKLLLLLPIGALVVVFMRILVGLKTSGTFMPVLIALAFLQTSLIPGFVSFVSIVFIGLLLRNYLSSLNLLMVARISTIIVIVIFIIGVLSLVGYHLGFNTGMTVTFFPIIIIAWTIERMSILWEEEGAREVLVQGGGSLLVAVLAYLFMSSQLLGHLFFHFPELNLSVIALLLLMGQYTGYKLTELRRFRSMELR